MRTDLKYSCKTFYNIGPRLLKAGVQIKGADDLKRAAAKFIADRLNTFRKLPEWAQVAAPDAELLSAVLEQCGHDQNAAD
jgi:hypothetical protein